MIMEIMYSRTVNYSLSLDEEQGRSLRKHLKITKKEMVRLLDDGDMYEEHGDEIKQWMSENAHLLDPTVDDEGEIEIEHLEYAE